MNSINMLGRLTAKPELKQTTSGTSVCSFTLAVSRPHVKDTTDFIPCVAWRQSAEFLSNYGDKGDLVSLSGSLQTRKYEDKAGQSRTAYEVVADALKVLGRVSRDTPAESPSTPSTPQFTDVTDDENLPF